MKDKAPVRNYKFEFNPEEGTAQHLVFPFKLSFTPVFNFKRYLRKMKSVIDLRPFIQDKTIKVLINEDYTKGDSNEERDEKKEYILKSKIFGGGIEAGYIK
jgi:hypothetical protein